MMVTLVLVIGVIFIFLRNASATIIPSMALPFAMLGTFAVMAVLDYSLDNLSLMALILSIGFVVDDAIVMLENIMRHIEHGEDPYTAAIKGSQEIGFTIMSMTVSLAAVFIPVLFMTCVLGRMFREFAVTITAAILVSGVGVHHPDSHALQPLPQSEKARHGAVVVPRRRVVLSAYAEILRLEPARRSQMASGHGGGVLRGVGLHLVSAYKSGQGIHPRDVDPGSALGEHAGRPGNGFDKMVEYQRRLADIVRADPNVEGFLANVSNGNYNQMQITLKPRKQRELSAQFKWWISSGPGASNFPRVQKCS